MHIIKIIIIVQVQLDVIIIRCLPDISVAIRMYLGLCMSIRNLAQFGRLSTYVANSYTYMSIYTVLLLLCFSHV